MSKERDTTMDYTLVLKDLQRQLDGIDGKRQALQASIAAISALIAADEQPSLPGLSLVLTEGSKPAIPPGFFKGKSVTQAYRDLMKLWPGTYTPPQIADALVAGGIAASSRTGLIQAVHSVLKREREKKEREAAEAAS